MLKRLLTRALRYVLLATLTFTVLVACTAQQPTGQSTDQSTSQELPPLVVGASPWPGFSSHYVAVAKNLFAEEGLTVEDQFFQVATDANTALLAGRLDMTWLGVPDMVFMAAKDPSLRLIKLADYSNGADGILVRGNVSKPEDLRGQKVAWEQLPLQVMLLNKFLDQANMTQNDVELLTMSAAEAATAFASRRVDIAVTYEPWLTKAAQEGQGTILFSSKDSNIIPDGLATTTKVIESKRASVLAYLRAIDKAVQFIRENPDEAAQIIAKRLGVQPGDVPGLLAGIRTFDVQENADIVFNEANSLNVVDSLKFSVETGKRLKLIEGEVDPTAIYDSSLVKELAK